MQKSLDFMKMIECLNHIWRALLAYLLYVFSIGNKRSSYLSFVWRLGIGEGPSEGDDDVNAKISSLKRVLECIPLFDEGHVASLNTFGGFCGSSMQDHRFQTIFLLDCNSCKALYVPIPQFE